MIEFLLLCLIVMVPAGLLMMDEIRGKTLGASVRNALAWIAIFGGCLFVIWAAGYVVGFPPPWFK
jgi:hypothetical protein